MFVGPTLMDDNNRTLMWVQHDLWFKTGGAWIDDGGYAMGSCFYLFSVARKSIMFHTDSNPLFFPERERLPSIDTFDHRVLQCAHDFVAAYYRWCNAYARPSAFSDNETEYRSYLLDSWKTYFRHEVAHLTFGKIDFSEQIVRAVLFQNTPQGYAAEDQIESALQQRYGVPFATERKSFANIPIATSNDQGFIYVMVSPALKENFLKIGKTTRIPQRRAEEISADTGVPLRYYVVFQALVSNCHEVERLVHTKLMRYRSNVAREFFELPLHQAIEAISTIARNYPPNPSIVSLERQD